MRAADVGWPRQRSALGRRREDALVPQILDHALAGHSIGRVEVTEVLQREALRAQLDGAERLCLRCAFTRDVAGWHVALFDGEQGLAGVSMQHEQHAGLGRLQDRGYVLAAATDRGEGGGRCIVVVPEIMVDGLEMPCDLAGRGLERDDRVRVAVVARPQAAEVVRARARSRREDEAALRVGHHDRPDICRTGARGTPILPARMGGILCVLRNRIPAPGKLPGTDVEGTHFAARRRDAAVVGDRGTGDDEVADHERRRSHFVGGELEWRVPQSLAQVDHPQRTEIAAGASRGAVHGEEACVDRRDEDPAPARRARRCLPVEPGADAAIGKIAVIRIAPRFRIEAPALGAGRGVERDQFPERCREIEHAVHHDRRRFEAGIAWCLDRGVSRAESPRDFE